MAGMAGLPIRRRRRVSERAIVTPLEGVLFALAAFLFVFSALGQCISSVRPAEAGGRFTLIGPLILAAFPDIPALAGVSLRAWARRRRRRLADRAGA
jgi:hypothetical protein